MPTFYNEEINTGHSVRIGSLAPDFELKSDCGDDWRLSDHLGNVTVLLFYPQNETLVCTKQLCSVRDNWEDYLETKAVIVGVSPATLLENKAFSSGLGLPIKLLSDPDRKITRQFSRHWLFPISFTRAVVIIDSNGIVRNREIMLRSFRPSDAQLITDIYTARCDAINEEYATLKSRADRTIIT